MSQWPPPGVSSFYIHSVFEDARLWEDSGVSHTPSISEYQAQLNSSSTQVLHAEQRKVILQIKDIVCELLHNKAKIHRYIIPNISVMDMLVAAKGWR